MYYPATRLLTVLDLLRARGELTGAELADRLEVHVRSVRRYIAMLQDLGVPIEITRGRHGCYRLPADYHLPHTRFDDDEALALGLLWARYRPAGPGGDDPSDHAAARAKLERALPAALRDRLRNIGSALTLRGTPRTEGVDSALLLAASRAIAERYRLWLRYRAFDGGESSREIDPYGLVYAFDAWYLVGYCHARRELRTFRCDRVIELGRPPAAGAASFAPPEGFDALAAVEAAIAGTPQRWRASVIVCAAPEELAGRMPPGLAMLSPHPKGALMECWVEDLDRLAHFLLGLDRAAAVVGPPELRAALAALGRRALALSEEPGERGNGQKVA